MKELTILYAAYKPNTAPTNRLISLLKGFDELEVEVQLVFLYPSANYERMDNEIFKHVHIHYLWNKENRRGKLYKFIRSFFDVREYVKGLPKYSKVLLISGSQYLPFITWRKDIEVYHERTEHPYVAKTAPVFLQKKYLKACTKTKGMFVISTALKAFFENLGVNRVSVVNMTVDTNRFDGIEKQAGKDQYIAYCGSASNNKDGVDDLLKAFAIVHKTFPELKLYIIGKTPARKQKDFQSNLELVSQLGVQDAVVFTGSVSAEQMPQLLCNAEMLVLCRPDSLQAQNGFPTKLGEYLLTGNPVVVTSVGDIPLFLEDGVSALVTKPKDIDAFASKMIWAVSHSQEAHVIGERGRQVALKHFNYKTEAKKMIDSIFS